MTLLILNVAHLAEPARLTFQPNRYFSSVDIGTSPKFCTMYLRIHSFEIAREERSIMAAICKNGSHTFNCYKNINSVLPVAKMWAVLAQNAVFKL